MSSGQRIPRWFEDDPYNRLGWELDQLTKMGWSFSVDEAARAGGRIVLRGTVPAADGTRQLTIVFPDTYPEQRVEIYDNTPDEPLELHQNPYGRNLCLLDNVPKAWSPKDDYAAWMVKRVLTLREAALQGRDGLTAISVPAPEPASSVYLYDRNAAVLVPEAMVTSPPGERGWFQLQLRSNEHQTQALLARVHTDAPVPADVAAPDELKTLLTGPSVRGAWFRLSTRPPWKKTAREFFDWASARVPDFPRLVRQGNQRKPLSDHEQTVTVFGFVYPDDGPDGTHDAWLIGMLTERQEHKRPVPGSKLLRPFIYSAADQARRIPSLAGLTGKRVAVIGLGTVGAPLVFELGRTGLFGEIRVIDHDFFSIWNVVRHPLDLSWLGVLKVQAALGTIKWSAPFTAVSIVNWRIGVTPQTIGPDQMSDTRLLESLGDFDLVIDATADAGATRFINRACLRLGVPLLVASVTEGGWGGEVVRSVPGQTGCYECYLWQLKEGSVPKPSQDPEADPVFTRGCGFPTFTGTGFDAASLAADAARLAVQTLLRGQAGGYPDSVYDVLIRHNRGAAPRTQFPRYEGHQLGIHPRCAWHVAGGA